MSRYIDAEALQIECREKKQQYSERKLTAWEKGVAFGLQTAIAALDMQPTADVAPVVHAKWIGGRYHARFENSYEEQCSECGKWSLDYSRPRCSSCGASMDLEVEA